MGFGGRGERALSEDYQINRAVRDAGLRVVFVPGCIIPSSDDVGWWEFLVFARRQLIITRVCEPRIWWLIAGVSATAVAGFWVSLGVMLGGLWSGSGAEKVSVAPFAELGELKSKRMKSIHRGLTSKP